MNRHSTGIAALDEALGGGLIPGKLAVIYGATGVGKTKFGISIAAAGKDQEGRRGIIMDFTARGDSQDHAEYAERMVQWKLAEASLRHIGPDSMWDGEKAPLDPGDYVNLFQAVGKRVRREQVSDEEWHDWNAYIQSMIQSTMLFLYSSFCAGRRRLVLDGLEPSHGADGSAQLEFFEYLHEQAMHRDSNLLARQALRENYYKNRELVEANAYDQREISAVVLVTSTENMLEAMLDHGIEEGDTLAVANTVIYMGRVAEGKKMGRALFIAKHRGSACSDDIIPFGIGESGFEF